MTQKDDAKDLPSADKDGAGKKPAAPKKTARSDADWQPLGTIRDHFVEQMKQDKDW